MEEVGLNHQRDRYLITGSCLNDTRREEDLRQRPWGQAPLVESWETVEEKDKEEEGL